MELFFGGKYGVTGSPSQAFMLDLESCGFRVPRFTPPRPAASLLLTGLRRA